MTNTQDFTQDDRFQVVRQLNAQILKHPFDPSASIGIQHDVAKHILPEASGRMIIPTAYGFPMMIDIDATHTPSMQGSIERNLYFLGSYEAGTLEIIRQSLASWGKGATFVDVGAHNGLMSIYAAHVGAAKVYSFEPNPSMFEMLNENIKLSSHDNIKSVALALGNEQGTVSIETNDQNSGAAHISESESASVHDIPVDTLDHVAQTEDIDRINLMLMDVEGYEHNVLTGAQATIDQHKPDLIIEYDPSDPDTQVTDFLKQRGYLLYTLENSRHLPGRLLPFQGAQGSTQKDNYFCFQPERAKALGLEV